MKINKSVIFFAVIITVVITNAATVNNKQILSIGFPPAVIKAFSQVDTRLKSVKSFSADYTAKITSIKGGVNQTGSIIQEPPFSLKYDMTMNAMGGIMNVRELTLCNGVTGWQIQSAPNGKVINVSRWGKETMEELFYVFREQALPILLTDDISNTYTAVMREVAFTEVSPKDGGFEFKGKFDSTSQRYLALLKIAATLGEEGIIKYMPDTVKLVIDKHGIATEWIEFNVSGDKIVNVKLSNVKINVKPNSGIFTYKPPKDVLVMDIGQALQRDRIHVAHPLLKKTAPKMILNYLAGKEKIIKPGGQPMVITFFTSWSVNSRKYLNGVDKLYGKFNLRGVKFITITDEPEPDKIKSFLDDARLTLPVYLDPKHITTKAYSVQVVPKSFVVNKNGIVVDVLEGNAPGTLKVLNKSIEKTLNK